jgi:hypothetical protein
MIFEGSATAQIVKATLAVILIGGFLWKVALKKPWPWVKEEPAKKK